MDFGGFGFRVYGLIWDFWHLVLGLQFRIWGFKV